MRWRVCPFLIFTNVASLALRQTSAFSSVNYLNRLARVDRRESSLIILQQSSPPPLAPKLAFEGMPSSPGWKKGKLEELTKWAVSKKANRPIICEYDSDWLWLWTRWRGTVLELTVLPILLNMCLCAGLDALVHTFSTSPPWPVLSVPPADDPLIEQLQGINKLWEYQLTLCTFILTFFIADAYKHWRTVYLTTRAIQGRINDICLLVSVAAERGDCTEQGCGVDGDMDIVLEGITTGYSERAGQVVKQCTRLIRLSHTFFWAATPTCSNGVGDKELEDYDYVDDGYNEDDFEENSIGPILLSPEGLERLVTAGELTPQEKFALIGSRLPPSQYAYIVMEWVGLHVMEGLKNGSLLGGNGFEENILRQITSLRAEYFNIGDYTAGRMPVAYVQLVQVLVDSLVFLAPFALYPEVGSMSILLSGLLTLFYKGLLDLSKSFLDPFGNEGHPGQNIRVDVLVSELNFGAGSRWVKAGETLPSNKVIQNSIFKNFGTVARY